MKKLLFVLAFAFIGQQSFSQMYIVSISSTTYSTHPGNNGTCDNSNNIQHDALMTTINPTG